MNILLIEDNPGDVRLIREMLKAFSEDFTVHDAGSLESGLRFLADQDFDVALLDLGLPDSRGLETITHFQARAAHLPVIVMTSIDDEDTGIQAVRQGAEDYLVKGQIDSRLLRRALLYALERKRLKVGLTYQARILENLSEAVVATDVNLIITSWNKASEMITGWTADKAIGKSIREFIPFVYPRGRGDEAVLQLQRDGCWEGELNFRRKDGREIKLYLSAKLLRDNGSKTTGMIAIASDITRRKQMEEELKLKALMLDNTVDAVFAWDMNNQMQYVNQAAITYTGYTREELMVRPFIGLVTPACAAGIKRQLALLQRDNYIAFECDVLRKDGAVITAEVNSNIVEIGAQKLTVSILRDISERKKLEKLREEFIGMVSHEMRTPLTVIIGVLNTLLSSGEKISRQDARQLMKDATHESEELAHIVENLLELSRFRAKQAHLNPEELDIKNTLQEVTRGVKKLTQTHRVSLSLPEKLPLVFVDPLRLKRILYNLMENAIKYSPCGGNIKVSAMPQGEEIVIYVQDEGKGMTPEEQERIFKPFERLAVGAEAAGIGLGLTVCKHLVEAHGGRLWVKSKPGKGSTFYFTLPLEQSNCKL